MQLSEKGLRQLIKFEGQKLFVYDDGFGFPTVGVGHLVKPQDNLQLGDKITQAQSDKFLRDDVASYEKIVNDFVRVSLTQNQFDMLVSLSFNIGIGNFKKSTLLKKLNSGDYQGAANRFSDWRRSAGRVVKGLITRRAKEREIFLS